MENITLSKTEVNSLKDIFNENYLIIKQINELENKIYDYNVRYFLKKVKTIHEKNLLTIMKLLDEKERFI